MLHATAMGGDADIQKLVVSASTPDDALRLMHVVRGGEGGQAVHRPGHGGAGEGQPGDESGADPCDPPPPPQRGRAWADECEGGDAGEACCCR